MAYRLKAGDLQSTVSIEKPVVSYTDWNEPQDSWSVLASCVRCRITAKGGGEQSAGDKQVSIVSYEVAMWYRPTLLPNMRLDWKGKKLNIEAVYDPDGRRVVTVALCKEVSL